MKRKDKNKSDLLIDNMVSSLKIHEELDKKLVKRLKLMPYLKKVYEFVAKDETSKEAEYFCDGFVEGADWRINSVWHDANEIPKKNDSYIVVYNRFGIKTDFWSHYRGWEKYRRADKVKKWAYIEDLLPTKEDEQ